MGDIRVKRRHYFVLALVVLAAIFLIQNNPTGDEWTDLVILGRLPGTSIFLPFEFMLITYIIVGMVVTRLVADVRNDYWKFRFFKLKASRTKKLQASPKEHIIAPAPAGEVQPLT